MGHRALVAYRQADGTFTLRYAHWGKRIAAAIGPETPLGGHDHRPEAPDVSDVTDALDVERRGGYEPPIATRVDPRPLARGATADEVVDAIDASYESLVVVSPTYETATYLVCSLDPTAPETGLAFAAPHGDPAALRSWFVETASRLSAAVAADALAREAARATLRRALTARATLYPADDGSFLRDR